MIGPRIVPIPNTAMACPWRSGGLICRRVACDSGMSPAELRVARSRWRWHFGLSTTTERDRGFADSLLEEDGSDPSVPLVSRGAIRREFPKRGARLAASWGVELRRRSSIWEFDPTSRDQTRGILLRHLDDAIQADGDMPV